MFVAFSLVIALYFLIIANGFLAKGIISVLALFSRTLDTDNSFFLEEHMSFWSVDALHHQLGVVTVVALLFGSFLAQSARLITHQVHRAQRRRNPHIQGPPRTPSTRPRKVFTVYLDPVFE